MVGGASFLGMLWWGDGGGGGGHSGGLGRAGAGGGVGLLAVEVAVAAAGGAAERVDGALLARGHELAAAVHGMPTDADRVVLEALPVPRATCSAASWRPDAPSRLC